MRRCKFLLYLLVATGMSALPATAPVAAANTSTGSARALEALYSEEWERGLRDYPENASYHGDNRYNDRWTDLSPAAIEVRAAANRAALDRLHEIGRIGLNPDAQLNFDTFELILTHAVERQRFHEELRPVDHKNGPQLAADIAETMPFRTLADYRNFLARMAALPMHIEQVIALMKRGAASGNTPPRVLIERVPAQIAAQIVNDPTRSPFYRPFEQPQASIAPDDRAKLQAEAKATIQEHLIPAFRRFQDYVNKEYLPQTRTTLAAGDLPDGAAYYEFLVRDQTTTNLGPDEIHRLGLVEVARLHEAMEALRREVGFQDSLQEFFNYLRTDPRFFYKTPDELLMAYRNIAKRIDPELVKVFRIIPRLPYGVRAIPADSAPDTTTAYYQGGADDGSRPGYYYVNLYKPEARPRWEMVPLTLHEAMPGHHAQFARALELPQAPMFRKTAYFVGYSEGWGLYAEQLGYDMGLYDDPYDRMGQLAYEMWRAVRLVVDTGIHAKGWSRAQAIVFFKENVPKTELDIVNEIDRYIGDPGQALAYKIGQLKISALRARAQRELGPRFDLRDYNDAVLAVGSVPLTTLEVHIDKWIAQQKEK
jgi:uncharacterized protein (DUF885 family)